MQLHGILVLYNSKLENSDTYNSIKNINNLNIIVCDNSTKQLNNEEFSNSKNNIKYINMHGNKGLSKAYNKAIELIEKTDENLVCIFDDDTTIPTNYFEVMHNYAKNFDAKVFLPVVYDQVALLSPCRIKGNKICRATSLDFDINNITAINSGMAIKASVFKNYKYDENLFLDYIDHQFIKDMKKRKIELKLVKEITLNQNFSSFSDSKSAAMKRFNIYKKDIKYFYRKSYHYYLYTILKRRIKLIFKYKSI